jgi:hypothetical protein
MRIAAAAMLLALAGCANVAPTQECTVADTRGGAIAGDAGMGAAIGAGGGPLGGLVVDQGRESRERADRNGVAAAKGQGRSGR